MKEQEESREGNSGEAALSTEDRRRFRIWPWALANPIAALTLTGLVVYGFLRLSASLFYGRLGVTPEEVGLGYVQTLAQSFLGLIVVALYYTLTVYLLPVFVSSLRSLLAFMGRLLPNRGIGQKLRAVRGPWRERVRHRWKAATGELASDVAGFLLVTLLLVTWFNGGEARNGEPSPFGFAGVFWRAEAARLFLPERVPGLPVESGQCVLYLGASGGVAVVFDPRNQTAYRIPSNQAVIVTGGPLSDVKKVPDCGLPLLGFV
jgi:hypothetical protein